jgi:hypothetical protein
MVMTTNPFVSDLDERLNSTQTAAEKAAFEGKGKGKGSGPDL